jgi:NAD(P)-dependent dehydrogenase (short-subunit alcohol dehydrogenase family)
MSGKTMKSIDFSLKGKTALVTGSSRGIGHSIALAFAKAGANVALTARGKEALETVKMEIEKTGAKCTAVPTDLSDNKQIELLHRQVVAELGEIDILVNNAGTVHIVALTDISREQFNEVMTVNTWSALRLSQLCYRNMKNKGEGIIINIASTGGVKPDIFAGAYSTSKAAMIMLTKQIACEWGNDGIRCNAICPGLVRTELAADLVAHREKHGFQNLVNRAGEPEEIATMALMLAGPAGSYCQGGVYMVDGGSTVSV